MEDKVEEKVRRRDSFEPQIIDSSSGVASQTLRLISNRLLILPVYIAIIGMVIVFLAISWSIRAGQLSLPRIKSLLSAAAP